MWNLLYQLASPKYFYDVASRYIKWLAPLSCLLLFAGLGWGLFFAPMDYQQKDAFRIIYVHVPCAFLSLSLYAFMGFLALLLLVWRIKLAGMMLLSCARVGSIMAILALITGSIWGKPMWGAWWVWDARLTSELILFFLYLAVLMLAHAFHHKEQGDRAVAVLTLVGLVDLPVIHYSVHWWNTLHQGTTLSLWAKPKIDMSMLYPLLLSLAGFALYAVLMILLHMRNELLRRGRHQQWVKQLLIEEHA